MNELHLFAGAGGGILGGILLGHTPVCAVEIEPYCQKVLMQRQRDGMLPHFPIWDDVRTFDAKPWRGVVEIVAGGFPCQGFSNASAGKQKAKNLWPEMLRVIGEVCPRFVFCENVSELAIIESQQDLKNCGFRTSRIKVSASDLGADHIRNRYWLLGDSDSNSKSGRSEHDEASRLSEFCCRVWENYQPELRISNGMASELDRTRAAGNGQIPAVAAFAWLTLRADLLTATQPKLFGK